MRSVGGPSRDDDDDYGRSSWQSRAVLSVERTRRKELSTPKRVLSFDHQRNNHIKKRNKKPRQTSNHYLDFYWQAQISLKRNNTRIFSAFLKEATSGRIDFRLAIFGRPVTDGWALWSPEGVRGMWAVLAAAVWVCALATPQPLHLERNSFRRPQTSLEWQKRDQPMSQIPAPMIRSSRNPNYDVPQIGKYFDEIFVLELSINICHK